jgi:CIC family chloride channel protein
VTHLRHWLIALRTRPPHEGLGLWRSVALSAVVGAAAGCGAVALVLLLQASTWLFLGNAAGYVPQGPAFEPHLFDLPPIAAGDFRRWVLLFLPAAGGLLSGWLVFRFAPEAAGHGTDAAIEAYHFHGGRIRPRVPPVKAIASSILIGTGGSAGLEGPISQIGSGVGSAIAALLRLPTPQRRMLVAAGMAGGVGALFHAPMAGALFAAEVLYRELDLEHEVLVPSIISSVTAYAVFSSVFGFRPLFEMPPLVFDQPRKLWAYILLAVVIAAGSRFYTYCFYAVHHAFRRLRIPLALKPAVGGLLTGLIGFCFVPVLGAGYGTVQRALVQGSDLAATYGTVTFGTLVAVFVLKTLATSFSVGSGGAGGIFGPAIVVGGALGGATGIALQHALPAWGLSVGNFTMLGMVAFFGCIANTPISTILMVSEMTGNFKLIVPAMWVCILAYVINHRVCLYRSQLPNRFEAPVHRGEMVSGILRNLHAADLLNARTRRFTTVTANTPALELARTLADSAQSVFPVVDDAGTLLGVVSHGDLKPLAAANPDLWQTLVIEDLMDSQAAVASPEDTLDTLLRQMEARRDGAIVVRSADALPRPLGVVSHGDIMDAYHAEMVARR